MWQPKHVQRAGPAGPDQTIAVVIPSFRVTAHVLDVIARIGPEVATIFVVDDACPDGSGDFVTRNCRDPRVRVIRHEHNRGVGGAMITGYRAALDAGVDIVVKIDGDGQMDPTLISRIARPVATRQADYAKGNRFHSLWNVRRMPRVRLYGNAGLSFMTKLSSGYWGIFDPTNGYTAIHAAALEHIEFANVSERYFFETDMLINLGNARAVVADVPMEAVYGDEVSNLHIRKELWPFLRTHLREMSKRIFYTYFLRDFSPASLQLLFGALFLLFGAIYGSAQWYHSISSGQVASTGTVMIAVLPIILGVQFLLNFLSYDMANEPRVPIQPPSSLADAPQNGSPHRVTEAQG